MLEACLHPDPANRRSALDVLALPYFDDIWELTEGTALQSAYDEALAAAVNTGSPLLPHLHAASSERLRERAARRGKRLSATDGLQLGRRPERGSSQQRERTASPVTTGWLQAPSKASSGFFAMAPSMRRITMDALFPTSQPERGCRECSPSADEVPPSLANGDVPTRSGESFVSRFGVGKAARRAHEASSRQDDLLHHDSHKVGDTPCRLHPSPVPVWVSSQTWLQEDRWASGLQPCMHAISRQVLVHGTRKVVSVQCISGQPVRRRAGWYTWMDMRAPTPLALALQGGFGVQRSAVSMGTLPPQPPPAPRPRDLGRPLCMQLTLAGTRRPSAGETAHAALGAGFEQQQQQSHRRSSGNIGTGYSGALDAKAVDQAAMHMHGGLLVRHASAAVEALMSMEAPGHRGASGRPATVDAEGLPPAAMLRTQQASTGCVLPGGGPMAGLIQEGVAGAGVALPWSKRSGAGHGQAAS